MEEYLNKQFNVIGIQTEYLLLMKQFLLFKGLFEGRTHIKGKPDSTGLLVV